MDAEKYDYQQFSGLPKGERGKRIAEMASGPLETRRFFLSRNPELKQRIKKLSAVVKQLTREHPEIISFNLFGSLVKGYANEESDVDAILFVERSLIDTNSRGKPFKYYDNLIRAGIKESLGLQDSQTKHCITHWISEEAVAQATKTGWPSDLAELFLLSIGRDINRFRKVVFDTLETMGPEGEERWHRIMEELWYFENRNLPEKLLAERRKLYPQTIAEGRKYFLQENDSRRPTKAPDAA